MKNSGYDDPTSKALRERYARLLGLGEEDFPEEKTKNKNRRPWFLFLLVLSAFAFGAWFFFDSLMENPGRLSSVPAKVTLERRASPETPESLTESGTGSVLSEQTDSDPKAGESAVSKPANGFDSPKLRLPGYESKPSSRGKPMASRPFLVVLLSTKSKEEAVERAIALGGEVILSTTGYYAVVLKHATYEQAKLTLKTLIVSGEVKEKPYLMTTDRVKEHVYPEIK